jgi:anti-sigma regulatory factor (Ser/Thr protein kinase)
VSTASEQPFWHEALFYAGEDEFLAGTLPFIRAGAEAGEPMLVAVPRPRMRALQRELDGEAEGVHFADMEELGRNPARIVPAWRDFLRERGGDGQPVRGIGEPIWAGRSPAELVECQQHEVLLNLAFADASAFWLLCPYDSQALDERVLHEARRSHPLLAHNDVRWESDAYVAPELAAAPFDGELPRPAGRPREMPFDREDLAALRQFVSGHAAGAGLDEKRTADLVLATSELATNSVLHAGGAGRLRMWREGETVMCEVLDEGQFDDPLLGRERPGHGQVNGRGLWMVNQLCDLVQMRSHHGGNVVRLHMSL